MKVLMQIHVGNSVNLPEHHWKERAQMGYNIATAIIVNVIDSHRNQEAFHV